MKKVLLSGFVILTFIGYAIQQRLDTEQVGIIAPNTQTTLPPTPTPQTMMGNTRMMDLAYKNGSYIGSVTDAYYGNLQVKAVISGGKISDVQFLQYPNDRRTSQMINSQAMPYLKQEAIQAQSAQVDGISGATQTSRAFVESLQSALNQAK